MAPFVVSNWEWYVEGEYLFQDKRFIEQWNTRWVDSYQIVDARVGLRSESWEAIFYVNNVFDNDVVQSAQTGPGISSGMFFAGPPRVRDQVIAYPATPRVYGLQFSYRFGQ